MNNESIIQSSPKPKKDKTKIALACTSVLAVAGVAFGVWGAITIINSANKDQSISNSQTTASETQQKNGTDTVVATETTEIESESKTITNLSDNIVIPNWGIKIKIPEDFQLTGAMYYDHSITGEAGSLALTGHNPGYQYLPEFADINKCKLGYLTAFIDYDENAPFAGSREKVYQKDNLTFIYESPQALCTTQQFEQEGELSAVEKIKNILKDNISDL